MAGFTSLTNIPLSVKAKINETIFMNPEANYVYALTAMQKEMPMHSGDTLRFPKYSRPSPFPNPLAESELDIDPQTLSKTFIDQDSCFLGSVI